MFVGEKVEFSLVSSDFKLDVMLIPGRLLVEFDSTIGLAMEFCCCCKRLSWASIFSWRVFFGIVLLDSK